MFFLFPSMIAALLTDAWINRTHWPHLCRAPKDLWKSDLAYGGESCPRHADQFLRLGACNAPSPSKGLLILPSKRLNQSNCPRNNILFTIPQKGHSFPGSQPVSLDRQSLRGTSSTPGMNSSYFLHIQQLQVSFSFI